MVRLLFRIWRTFTSPTYPGTAPAQAHRHMGSHAGHRAPDQKFGARHHGPTSPSPAPAPCPTATVARRLPHPAFPRAELDTLHRAPTRKQNSHTRAPAHTTHATRTPPRAPAHAVRLYGSEGCAKARRSSPRRPVRDSRRLDPLEPRKTIAPKEPHMPQKVPIASLLTATAAMGAAPLSRPPTRPHPLLTRPSLLAHPAVHRPPHIVAPSEGALPGCSSQANLRRAGLVHPRD